VQFALVQEGLGWPAGAPFELIGRLPEAESLVFLGPRADQVKALTDLRGMRIGIGPIGSGTEQVVRQVLAPLAELDLTCRPRTSMSSLSSSSAESLTSAP
jgi:hypothetical protein